MHFTTTARAIFTPPSSLTSSTRLCIPFEDSLSEEQIDVFHKLLDCVSETSAAEMRAAYKAGFKDGASMIREVRE